MTQEQTGEPVKRGWTDARLQRLQYLWNKGMNASQIAVLLGGGINRNAVIAKVHRMGLTGRSAKS